MKTLLYPEFNRLELAEEARPLPLPDEVILRVEACGICGSELESLKNQSPRRPPPLVMGHEFCGTVDELGSKVRGLALGQQVISNSIVPCGVCIRCRRGDTHLCANRQVFGMHRAGAFAQFVAVPARSLLAWPPGLPAAAACLAEPLANGVHMVNLTGYLKPHTVLVIGAGPIGLMAQQAFRALLGTRVVVADLSPERLAVATSLGAEHVWNPRETDVVAATRGWTEGEGADVVIDAVGSGLTKRQSVEAARPGGAAVWIGLHESEMTFDSYSVTLPEKHVLGTYAATQEEMETAIELMAQNRVDVTSWVQQFPLAHGVEAFDRMLAAKGNDIKAVILSNE